eukprot:1392651-Amphidinium_carterae.1
MGKYRRQTQALLQIPASGPNIFHFARIASQCRGPWDHLYTFILSCSPIHKRAPSKFGLMASSEIPLGVPPLAAFSDG